MSVTTTVKQLSIATGLYRPMRWLSRRVRPQQLRAHLGDVDLYRSLLPRDALCFDVGANTGIKSEALLRARCGPWENWSVVEAALGSAAGLSTFYAREPDEQSSFVPDWEGKLTGTYHMPVLTLDSAIQHFGRPFFCKIDVEGWEIEVFKGLSQPLPLISFEFHLTGDHVEKAVACLERLSHFGRGRVNITPAEGSAFHLAEWEPLEKFLEWFPGDLKQSLPGKHYGDIFVEFDTA